MKRFIWKIAALLIAVSAAGFLVVVSGIMPITASSGHWPITAWFLHFSMQRSVSTHSLGIDVPPLDDFDLLLKGAGHYETGCRACHGSPELKQPRIAQQMTPSPPYLPSKISEWDPERAVLSRETWRKIHRHARVAFAAARRRGMGDGRVSAEAAESRRGRVSPPGARRTCRNPAHPKHARAVGSPLHGRSELHAMSRQRPPRSG